METELFIKDKAKKSIVIKHDDLKFDGEHVIIPSYYVELLLDYIRGWNSTGTESQADAYDYDEFRKFLAAVEEYKKQVK